MSGRRSRSLGSLGLALVGLLGCEPRTDLALWQAGETDAEVGDPAADPCGYGQKVCFELAPSEAVLASCGGVIEIEGPLTAIAPDRYSIQDCDGCEVCDGEHYEIHVRAPRDWQPSPWPDCARIHLEFAAADAPWSCAWTSGALWSAPVSPGQSPEYIAASIDPAAPTTVPGFEVTHRLDAPKACREAECCPATPGAYTLTIAAGGEPPRTLAENDELSDLALADAHFEAKNLRSHVHDKCDATPHFDWIIRRSAVAPRRVPP